MRWVRAFACLPVLLLPALAVAQAAPPSEKFNITARSAATWDQDSTHVILLQGPVKIELDRAELSADNAVIWLPDRPKDSPAPVTTQIALLGNAQLYQQTTKRSGPRLFVAAAVGGAIQLTADDRVSRDQSNSALYKQAADLRAAQAAATLPGTAWRSEPGAGPSPQPGPPAKTLPPQTVRIKARYGETVQPADGKVAVLVSGGVLLVQQRPKGELVTLQADRAVVFTAFDKPPGLEGASDPAGVEMPADAAYLEGDVRITLSPGGPNPMDQRLEADRAYYEFASDRAILTDVVVHSVEPTRQVPVILRAGTVRQLARNEWRATNAAVTTSAFATPSYSINASQAYVRTIDLPDDTGNRVTVSARDTTIRAFGVPFFYFPVMGASLTDRGLPIRRLGLSNSTRRGIGATTVWGLFESLGQPAPRHLDVSYRLDYFSDRGPAVGLDGSYDGGLVTETTKDPWNFTGDWTTYWVHDRGFDDLGRARVNPPDPLRGQFLWEHQHFFPNDYQVQLRAGYVTDPTFLEEWFPQQFYTGSPHDLSLYVKRQRDIDAATFLVNAQPQDFVTTAEMLQEGFEVEHLPQVGYHHLGDSLADDTLTFFSSNHVAGLRYGGADTPLSDYGFRGGNSPGLPSAGTTGRTNDQVWRGYSRQEVGYPLAAGPFKLVPYVLGIYTGYSDSPRGADTQNRLYGGAGVRLSTAFWKVDDTVRSDLLDIHRLRHVVEPEVNAYTSGQTVDRDQVFVYEEQYDPINDISALQLALRQRWQTKRGGPGRWRSVDVLSWNLETNLFANQPTAAQLAPAGFRGLYFPSSPETSIPRNSVNSDLTWRVSDTTAVLADAQYNLDNDVLATGSVGVAVRRDPRVSYYVGTRYIDELHSAITTVAADYELSRKYSLALAQSWDFNQEGNVYTSLTVTRRFDRFLAAFRFYYDPRNNEEGFSFNLIPEGLGPAAGQIPSVFGQ